MAPKHCQQLLGMVGVMTLAERPLGLQKGCGGLWHGGFPPPGWAGTHIPHPPASPTFYFCQQPQLREDRAFCFPETRAPAGPHTGPFVWPLAWWWNHAHPGGVHQQLQGFPISGLHQAEKAGLVLCRAVTDAALGRQVGEAGPPQHLWIDPLPTHSRSARRTALPSCGCSEVESL